LARDLIKETQNNNSMPIMVMKLKSFWERHRARRWALTDAVPLPVQARMPKPFQPLTRDESIEVLDDAVQWVLDESQATIAMPDGPAKERRGAELVARDKSLVRDFLRLARQQAG